jgi:hypothetical protein
MGNLGRDLIFGPEKELFEEFSAALLKDLEQA